MKSPFPRRMNTPPHETLLSLCCVICFACFFGSYMRIPVVPLYARVLGADVVEVGIINSSFLLMAGLLSLPFGLFSDRIGRKFLILCGLSISSSSSLLLFFCATPLQVMGVYLFFGVGLAAFAPTMMSYVTDISPPNQMGRSYGWYTMALYGGMSLGPATGGLVAQWLGIREVFLVSGFLLLMMAGVVHLLLPNARHVIAFKHQSHRGAVSLRQAIGNRPLLACWLVTLGGCFGLGMFITFLPLHAQDHGISVGQIGMIFAAQAFFNAASRIPFGHLSDRISDRSILVVAGSFGCSACMAALGISTDILSLLLCAAVLGICMGVSFTALGALICDVAPTHCRGLAMGGYNACIYFGMMLSAAVMGSVIKEIGFGRGFLVSALFNFATACLFHVALRNRSSGANSAMQPIDQPGEEKAQHSGKPEARSL